MLILIKGIDEVSKKIFKKMINYLINNEDKNILLFE